MPERSVKSKIESSNSENIPRTLPDIKQTRAFFGLVSTGSGGRKFGGGMIDWQRLKDLKQEIGDDNFGEVVVLFLEEADEVVARLPAAKTAKTMENDLHFLKGSALNLGFTDLAQICQLGERSAAAGETDLRLEEVVAVYATSRELFLRKLADLAAA